MAKVNRFSPWIKYAIGVIAIVILLKTGALNLHDLKAAIHHSPQWIILALGFYFLVNLIASTRWWYLLRHAQLQMSWFQVVRLHMIGVFFSALLPGGTAGDFAKGFYLFRKGDAQGSARAVASIVMDRLIGLLGMALLTVAGGWTQFHLWASDTQMKSIEILVLGLTAGIFLVLVLALFPDSPKLLGVYGWVSKIPGGSFLTEAVKALSVYRSRPQVLLVSLIMTFFTHTCLVFTYWSCATALGSNQGLGLHFVAAPLCTMLNGVPISPAGLGVGEAFGNWVYGRLGFASGSEVLALVHLCVFITAALFSSAYFFQKRR